MEKEEEVLREQRALEIEKEESYLSDKKNLKKETFLRPAWRRNRDGSPATSNPTGKEGGDRTGILEMHFYFFLYIYFILFLPFAFHFFYFMLLYPHAF